MKRWQNQRKVWSVCEKLAEIRSGVRCVDRNMKGKCWSPTWLAVRVDEGSYIQHWWCRWDNVKEWEVWFLTDCPLSNMGFNPGNKSFYGLMAAWQTSNLVGSEEISLRLDMLPKSLEAISGLSCRKGDWWTKGGPLGCQVAGSRDDHDTSTKGQ